MKDAIKSVSVKKNYVLNLLLNLLNLIFPLITFPYVSRVLGTTGIGKVDFATSVVQYFIFAGSLGIPLYGVREIARARNSKQETDKVFSELFIIGIISNLLSTVALLITILSVKKFNSEGLLFYLTSVNMLLNVFAIDWLFQGFEDYKYITIRSIIIKVISIFFIYMFIKQKNDYILYSVVSIIGISGSNILNILSARKYVKLQFRNLNLKKHLKPLFYIFSSQIAASIYLNLTTTMLGFMAAASAVGIYSAANKINKVVIAVVTALGLVLTPRLSTYFKNKQMDEIHLLLKQSIQFVLLISIPFIFALIAISDRLVPLFLGAKFGGAVMTMRILSPVILLVGISNVTNTQILIPMGKERYIAKSVVIAAVANFIANLCLIPIFKENGAAIATMVAELAVTIIQMYYSRNIIKNLIFNKENLNYPIASIAMTVVILIVKFFVHSALISLGLAFILGCSVYFLVLFLLKDKILNIIMKYLLRRA